MTTKHTPGPWEVEVDERTEICRITRSDIPYIAGFNIVSKDSEIVGCEGILSDEQAAANARLIAAAPDLLEAADYGQAALMFMAIKAKTSEDRAEFNRRADFISAAIAKARGAAVGKAGVE